MICPLCGRSCDRLYSTGVVLEWRGNRAILEYSCDKCAPKKRGEEETLIMPYKER